MARANHRISHLTFRMQRKGLICFIFTHTKPVTPLWECQNDNSDLPQIPQWIWIPFSHWPDRGSFMDCKICFHIARNRTTILSLTTKLKQAGRSFSNMQREKNPSSPKLWNLIITLKGHWYHKQSSKYLVALIDAIDELLGRGVPQELDGGRIHSFCLDILRWCGWHCSTPARWRMKQKWLHAEKRNGRKKKDL